MALEWTGFTGKLLEVNLEDGCFGERELDHDVAREFLGGKGLGAYILYREMAPGTDPLSPDNLLLFLTGPLTGTIAPGSGKFCVVTKSPHTGTFVDSHCGGPLGPSIKYAGYDGIVIRGRAEHPSLLIVDSSGPRLIPAGELWGTTTSECQRRLESLLGEGYGKAVIGPAGEKMLHIASIISEERAAGRGGVGAVMGSKNLKAVCVKGEGSVAIQSPSEMRRASWAAHRMLRMSELTVRSLPLEGTCNILETINEAGALPTKNFSGGRFEHASLIAGSVWRDEVWTRDVACPGCPIACSKVSRVKEGKYEGEGTEGPDYETVWAFGPQCYNADKASIVHLERMCDLYGLDTISAGNITGFLMESYEREIISRDELGGIDLKWGDTDGMHLIVREMCLGSGLGRFLARGVKRISQEHPEAAMFAMHVKGLELPAYSPRASKGMALAYATSDRGGCHLRGYPAMQELLGLRGGADPLQIEGKARLVMDSQDEIAVVDSADICLFGTFGFGLREICRMINAATGFDYHSAEELKRLGERIYNLTRLFNLREGFSRRDDTLPERCLAEPMPDGPARGQVVELEPMLNEYYELRGWGSDGRPSQATLERLDLNGL